MMYEGMRASMCTMNAMKQRETMRGLQPRLRPGLLTRKVYDHYGWETERGVVKSVRSRGLMTSYEGSLSFCGSLGRHIHAPTHYAGTSTDVARGDRPRSARTPALQAEPERGRDALRSRWRRIRDATRFGMASTGAPAGGGVGGGVGNALKFALASRGGLASSERLPKSSFFGAVLGGMVIGADEWTEGEVGEGGGEGKLGMPSMEMGSDWKTWSTRSGLRANESTSVGGGEASGEGKGKGWRPWSTRLFHSRSTSILSWALRVNSSSDAPDAYWASAYDVRERR